MDKFPGFKKVIDGLPKISEEQRAIAEARHAEELAVVAKLQERSERVAELRNEAPMRARQLLAEKVPELSDEQRSTMSPEEKRDHIETKIAALKVLMLELAKTHPGTTVPLNNDNQFVVEAMADLILEEERLRDIMNYDQEELGRYIREITQFKQNN